MQANPYGTWTEQKLYKAGFLTASERKQQGIKDTCGSCGSLDQKHGAHCKKHDFKTRTGAVCKEFKERTAEDI